MIMLQIVNACTQCLVTSGTIILTTPEIFVAVWPTVCTLHIINTVISKLIVFNSDNNMPETHSNAAIGTHSKSHLITRSCYNVASLY